MRVRRRISTALLAAVVLLVGGSESEAYAGMLPEDVLAEEESLACGIMVIENQQHAGSVELEYNGHREIITCDYSEFEIPMNVKGSLRIMESEGYDVAAVSADGEVIYDEQGVYYWSMDREFMTLTVEYTHNNQEEEEDSSSDASKEEEQVFRDEGKNAGATSNSSVSAITYDAEVTYLNTEDSSPEIIEVSSEYSEELKVVTVPGEETLQEAQTQEDIAPSKEKKSRSDEEGGLKEAADETEKSKKKSRDKLKKASVSKKLFSSGEDPADRDMENGTETIEARQQALVTFPNLSLYIVVICCIIGLKKIWKLDKKG